MRRLRCFILALIIFVIFAGAFNYIISEKCNKLLEQKNITAIKHGQSLLVRDRGGILKDASADDNDLLLFGTSELAFDGDQNPTKMFPFEGAEYDVSIFGRPCTQCIQLAAMINSTEKINADSRITVIMTMSWFYNKYGISSDDYNSNFSQYQFYKIMSNKNISKENKLYYAKNCYRMLRHQSDYLDETVYAYLYSRNNFLADAALVMLKPYYKLCEYILSTKDKVQAYKLLVTMPDNDEENKEKVKSIDWDAEEKKAEQQSMEGSTNDLTVKDDYYNKNLRDIYDSIKDKDQIVDMVDTKEFKDYKFFLSTCKENGIKPLIVLMPVSGKYYDYSGIGLEKRQNYYKKMNEMAKEYGFDTIDLSDKEYEPYYMRDIMHPGSKGWLDMIEKISEYYKNKEEG